tara:strand:+ start:683 stop:886 length:204 start_codon:yes stop_codon:yes gene_type:complete
VETHALPLMKNVMKDQAGLHALLPTIVIVGVQILVIAVTSLLLTASTIPAELVAMIRLAHVMAKRQI